jgi:23S rRNA pseudouridine1911/1915/1917 synthase
MDKHDKKINFVVKTEDKNERIDKFLFKQNIGLSRSKIQKLINLGKVKVNEKIITTKNFSLSTCDIIEINDLSINGEPLSYKPQNIDIKILYEDDYLIAISKEPGIVVYPGAGHKENTLLNALIHYYNKLSSMESELRAGIVHRLDKDTSGIILIAKTPKIHELLSEEFKQRQVSKKYVALVLGNFKEEAGIINMPIGRSKKDRKKMGVAFNGRNSISEFKVLEQFDDCALLEVYPKTGRTHQIRVHFSFIGHPIIGDKDYGNKEAEKIAKEIGLSRQFLHAKSIKFIHPFSGESIEIIDELSDDLKNALKKLKTYQ